MKKILTIFAWLVAIAVTAQSEMPKFSTESAPTYYKVAFRNGGGFLQDNGPGVNMTTAARTNDDAQLFAFIGTSTSFKMLSKKGNFVNYANARFATNATGDALAIRTTATTGYFEITVSGNTSQGMNQWGGAGVGKELGLWNSGDSGNALSFLDPNDMPEFDVTGATSFTPESKHTLWYHRPSTVTGVANEWMEYSLPIGNGMLGASLFGGIKTDEIQFNEKTLWTGGPNDMGSYGTYRNFGSVIVKNLATNNFSTDGTKPVKDYVRFLDIEKGVGGVNFTDAAGTKYTRRYISSFPDGVIAVRYKAEGANKLSLHFSYKPGESLNNGNPAYTTQGYGYFSGSLTTISYNTRFKVIPTGGTLTRTTAGIEVKDADEVLLILGAATSFDSSRASRTSGGISAVSAKVKTAVDNAETKGWDALYADHVADVQALMGRVNLQIGNAASTLNTEELIKYYNASAANKKTAQGLFLEQLYFYYGRYLMLGSSRGVNVPSNLQGIWNNKAQAPWNSDIHTNINVQMNYWPAEPTNLSELHLPLLNFIIDNAASANYRRAATTYGKPAAGWANFADSKDQWTVFTESNIFGGMSTWGNNYFVANAWYVSHLWQHYRYTLDQDFLRRAFPAMWGSAKFWMGRMIQDRGGNHAAYKKDPDGTYVAPNEYSAEQNDHPNEDGTAHAQQLITDNLQTVAKAIEILGAESLGVSEADLAILNDYLEKTDKGLHVEQYTNKWGTINGVTNGTTILREWKYAPYSVSNDQGHRHMSHLMCLYPLSQVEPGDGFFEAAVNSLALRGDAATGWSMGWKVNLWARAKDGDHAHIILRNSLKHSTDYGTNQYAGGIYYNLFDSHSPFQIDGNFGVCAGVAELLLQSHRDYIDILPALPSDWAKGSVSGLKAIGNFTVGIDWANKKPTKVTIESHKGAKLVVKSPIDLTTVEVLVDYRGAKVVPGVVNGTYEIECGEGQRVDIDYAKPSVPTSLSSVSAQAPADNTTYDLSGRRVKNAQKGLYIVGGKKVVF